MYNTCIPFVGNWKVIKDGTDIGVVVWIVSEPACCGEKFVVWMMVMLKPDSADRVISSSSLREVIRPCFLVQCLEMMRSLSLGTYMTFCNSWIMILSFSSRRTTVPIP
jgi:hypothetical protein